MDTGVYNMKVLPLVRRVPIKENGLIKYITVSNLSSEEIRNMSCEPKMLQKNNDDVFFMELPPTYHDTRIKWTLFYIYDDLTIEEKEMYKDRVEEIPVTINTVVSFYTAKGKKKVRN